VGPVLYDAAGYEIEFNKINKIKIITFEKFYIQQNMWPQLVSMGSVEWVRQIGQLMFA
jgi:hypothetical protein